MQYCHSSVASTSVHKLRPNTARCSVQIGARFAKRQVVQKSLLVKMLILPIFPNNFQMKTNVKKNSIDLEGYLTQKQFWRNHKKISTRITWRQGKSVATCTKVMNKQASSYSVWMKNKWPNCRSDTCDVLLRPPSNISKNFSQQSSSKKWKSKEM